MLDHGVKEKINGQDSKIKIYNGYDSVNEGVEWNPA